MAQNKSLVLTQKCNKSRVLFTTTTTTTRLYDAHRSSHTMFKEYQNHIVTRTSSYVNRYFNSKAEYRASCLVTSFC